MENLRLPPTPDRGSSYFNRKMLLGAAGGALLAPFTAGISILAGAAIGGYFGKKEQEEENAKGAIASPPGFLNGGLVTGALLGLAAAVAVPFFFPAIAVSIGSIGTTFGGLPLVGPTLASIGSAIGITGGATALGAAAGSLLSYSHQASDYAEAQNYTASRVQPSMTPTAPAPIRAPSITPEEAKELNDRLAAGRNAANPGPFAQVQLNNNATPAPAQVVTR